MFVAPSRKKLEENITTREQECCWLCSLSFYVILGLKDDQVNILSCYTIEKGEIKHRLGNV